MTESKTPNFYIRDLPIYGDAILAPMDGYSDWPFRSLCRELGSAMSYTEFIKVEKILSKSKQPAKRMYFNEPERPITFQIYGEMLLLFLLLLLIFFLFFWALPRWSS
ncbi:MAG: tRNA-dihydrouridine synthase [Anaerolineae bacterium]|nr:tRNA-dihydrouridine synthase [Anaerolineae bacterium]